MLVLGRRAGEAIRIGEEIIVTINKIRGGRVTVGIDAPKEIPITRVGRKEEETDAQ